MRVASVQAGVILGDPDANAKKSTAHLRKLSTEGVHLAVLPECYLTGYCVETEDRAREIAIPANHSALEEIQTASSEFDVAVAVGFAEAKEDRLYNSAALFVPGETPRYYRKTHLPELGFDKFATPGDGIHVFDTKLGKIGIIICFDMRFPEPARVLALQGADVILIPTNWPDGALVSADTICLARAAESRVWVVTCNRVGTENGFHFIGRSKIISPVGGVVAEAEGDEQVLLADIDLAEARQKRTVTIPGKYETDVFEPRRPELYGSLSAKSTGPLLSQLTKEGGQLAKE